jgi:hypothetical protein
VLGVLETRVMPVVELGRAENPTQRAERNLYVGVYEDGPARAKDDETGEQSEIETEHHGGEVLRELGRDTVDRVFAVSGEPIEVLGRVVDGVKAPQEIELVARPVKPIDAKVTENDGEHSLRPDREVERDAQVDVRLEPGEKSERHRVPHEVLAEEEAHIDRPGVSKNLLRTACRQEPLERHEHAPEHGEASESGGEAREHHFTVDCCTTCCCGVAVKMAAAFVAPRKRGGSAAGADFAFAGADATWAVGVAVTVTVGNGTAVASGADAVEVVEVAALATTCGSASMFA